ncbi:MAG: SRPBCC family protein [Angustibacter sp.]
MARVRVERDVAASAHQVWALLTDWPSHGRWVPLTRVRTTSARPDGVGASFVGRTAVGPLGFDDPMTVTLWQPPTSVEPGRCTVRKSGRLVLGEAGFVVEPVGSTRCRVTWSEDIEIAGVRRLPFADAVTRWAGARAFGSMLRKVAREAERA